MQKELQGHTHDAIAAVKGFRVGIGPYKNQSKNHVFLRPDAQRFPQFLPGTPGAPRRRLAWPLSGVRLLTAIGEDEVTSSGKSMRTQRLYLLTRKLEREREREQTGDGGHNFGSGERE